MGGEDVFSVREILSSPNTEKGSVPHFHPEAQEEFIDIGKVVPWLFKESIRDLVAQCPMTAVFPEERKNIGWDYRRLLQRLGGIS